ncbi:M23 family metallopeptidase [Nocardioides panacis]|uniref:M23 family metallopeptidase n=1 Tax=Nocardioides panacis TaxID=2849501 RepID=A0A975T1W8_9ACTN|nr:M23 family metallopeptidase [Nocardioides panacis]QWZ09510.1 M23 family metallopeptidase [Nocardioides panacis]
MRLRRLLAAAVVTGGLVLAGMPGTAYAKSTDGPDFEMPFVCGDTWTGSSRSSHSPSHYSIDWNRPDDLGALMTAAAPGVVTSVVDLGSRSYGRYVIVDHGSGWSTLYAHLLSQWVTVGQSVDQGQIIGQVGSTGGSTGPHLHFEERMNRRDLPSYFHRVTFKMGSTQASTNCGDTVVPGGDWNRDGSEEPALFRRGKAATFILRRTGTTPLRVRYGVSTDQPVSGDWNGDGLGDVGVRRPGWKAFLLRNADGTTTQVTFGKVSDVGVTGDWDGNGTTEVGVWSPATRVFTLRNADGSARTVALGALGDRPVTGDWNGDRITDLGVWTPSTGTFTMRTQTRDGAVTTATAQLGTSADQPVSGDWDGNGTNDLGVWSPSTATYQLRATTGVTSTRMGLRRN